MKKAVISKGSYQAKRVGTIIAALAGFLATVTGIWFAWEANERSKQERAAKIEELLDQAKYTISGDGALGLGLSCKPTLERQRRFEKGRSFLRQAEALAPDDARIIGAFGSTYLAECDWQEAENSLNRCIEFDPKNAMCHQQLGKALQRQGKSGYLKHYQLARKLQSDDLSIADALNIAMEIAADTKNDHLLLKLLRENPEHFALRFEASAEEIERKFGKGSAEKLQALMMSLPELFEKACEIDLWKLEAMESQLSKGKAVPNSEADVLRQELLARINAIRQQQKQIGCGTPT